MTDSVDSTNLADQVADAALDILREHGPVTAEKWAALMAHAGLGTPEELLELAEDFDSENLAYFEDGRNAVLDQLIEGRVLTHRLTEAEIASEIVAIIPDLSAIVGAPQLADDMLLVVAGIHDEFIEPRMHGAPEWPTGVGLLLPRGLLEGNSPGDLIAFECAGGVLSLVEPDALADVSLTAGLEAAVPVKSAGMLDCVIWQTMGDYPDIFRVPAAPITELLAAAGFECDSDFIARVGFDFAAHRRSFNLSALQYTYDLTEPQALAVVKFIELAKQLGGDPDAVDPEILKPKKLNEFSEFGNPDVAIAALESVVSDGTVGPSIGAAAELIAESGPRKGRVGALWLAARAALNGGRVLESERLLESVLELDGEWYPAVEDLARLSSIRGDAVRVQSLLGRIEEGTEDPLYEFVGQFLPVDRPELGRNDKCWCGSDRKYKSCHLGKSDLTADQHAQWLTQKGVVFLHESEFSSTLEELVAIRAEHWADGDATLRAMADGLLFDVALIDGGVLGVYLEWFGELLPESEREMAAAWLETERSVYEVLATAPGEGMTLRDVRTDLTTEVIEHKGSSQVQVGDLVCTRVTPVGDELQLFGGLQPVEPEQRDQLVALLDAIAEDADDGPDIFDLVELLSARFAPAAGGEANS
ncbi:SEC-C domain-containing protein [Tomitella biformata]|uniref:SEC-C domain-containing protein n=1 Tax=Tomitella biformata TaxID=630403 RepID=UPI000463FC34|nr:SEC-C domain-containing protein [Tomitella biformata]